MKKSSLDSQLKKEIENGSLVCPDCKGALMMTDCHSNIRCHVCRRQFKVMGGIPIFADEQSMDSFKSTESAFHSRIATEAFDAHRLSTIRVQNLHERILKPILTATSEGGRILEAGIGPGLDMAILARRGRRVFGIDIAYAMCLEAISLNQGQILETQCVVVQADAEALPFPDRHFEAVVCVASLHHFRSPERALSEMFRALRPDGTASIGSEPNSWPYKFRQFKHSQSGKNLLRLFRDDYTIDGGSIADSGTEGFDEVKLVQMAREAGFEIVEMNPCWYLSGFLSLFGFMPPRAIEIACVRTDDIIANIPWARRYCWKWNLVLRKPSR